MNVGSLVSYVSIKSGTVKGKITSTMRDRFGEFHMVKVTTSDVSAYPKGTMFAVPVGSAFLSKR